MYNTFRLLDIVRRPSGAILIRVTVWGSDVFFLTVQELLFRIAKLTEDGLPDYLLTEERKALEEFQKEKSKDEWPPSTTIFDYD